MKQIWLITYGSSNPSLTHQTLADLGPDECYTATWRESKFTLVHLPRKRSTTLEAVVACMKGTGTTLTGIFGYEAVASTSNDERIEDHPGFMRIVDLANRQELHEAWARNGLSVEDNRRGLLWKHLTFIEPERMTRGQLLRRIKACERKTQRKTLLRELDRLKVDYDHALEEYMNMCFLVGKLLAPERVGAITTQEARRLFKISIRNTESQLTRQ